MALVDLYDWLRVIEADEIKERLRMRSDLYLARPYDKQHAAQSNNDRQSMVSRYDELMMVREEIPQETLFDKLAAEGEGLIF